MKERRNPHFIYLGRLVRRSVLIILIFLAASGLMLVAAKQLTWLGVLLIIPLPIALLINEYVWIDEEAKITKSAVVMFGKAYFWNTSNYSSLKGILIKKASMTKTMKSRGSSSTFKYIEFDAFLQFEGGEPFYLFSDKDPEKLLRRIQPISKELQVNVLPHESWEKK